MEFPLVGKIRHPFPWLLGLMAGGMVVVGTSTYFVIQNSDTQPKIDSLTVPVEQQNLTLQIKASGTVEPVQNVNISPKNPGTLTRLLVDQGDRVRTGQVIAVMDNRELQAQGVAAEAKFKEAIANLNKEQTRITGEIAQAQARYEQAQARLETAKQRIPKQIDQARQQLRAGEARLQLATNRIKRNESLLAEGAITQDKFDEEINEYRSAQANLSQLLQRLEELKNTGTPEVGEQLAAVSETNLALEQRKRSQKSEIEQLKAAALSTQAELERIKIQFKDTVIRSPFDGVVTQKYATEGAFVAPTTSASSDLGATSTSIVAIARGLEIVAKVPEVDIGQLKPGQLVNVVADAFPDRTFQGRVRRIAPEAVVKQDVTSFEVRIALVTGQEQLLSKMNVDVTFLGQQLKDILTVPTVAIVTKKGETGVMIPGENNKPIFKPITIGQSQDDKTQVLQGLKPGDKVFTDLPEDFKKQQEE
ncbi:MAG: efflux RND transporter periplasmic adaptor subunit [Xenococcaceae cyanobacterium]